MPRAAILFVFASGVLFACLDTSAKYLVLSGMSPLFVSWARFGMHALLALVLLRVWRDPKPFRTGKPLHHLLRGIFLFGSTIFNFLALQTLQLAETSAISFAAPMVVTALAGPLLGEWAGWRRWIAVLAGFAGVLVVARPGFGSFDVGHVFAVASTLSYCFYVIMTRRMAARESAESLIFYSALAPALLMAPSVPFTASMPPDLIHGAILLMLGLFGGLGHWFLIRAYRLATATALAPFPYLQMVWMVGFGFLVFDQLPDAATLTGAGIIVASGLYIVHREHRLRVRTLAAPTAEDADLARRLASDRKAGEATEPRGF